MRSLLRRHIDFFAASSLNLAAAMQDWIDVMVKDDVKVKVAVFVRLRRVIMRGPPNSFPLPLELLMTDGHHNRQEYQS